MDAMIALELNAFTVFELLYSNSKVSRLESWNYLGSAVCGIVKTHMIQHDIQHFIRRDGCFV